MATSSIPAAVDYLVAQVAALPVVATAIDPIPVSDGWPDARGNRGVAIGITPDDDDADSVPVHAQLGAQMEWEEFGIPCLVWAYVGGGSASSAQKTARDQAFALHDAIVTMIRADRTLGNALHSGAALLTDVRVRQTGTADEAGTGRTCEIRFVVRCRNRF